MPINLSGVISATDLNSNFNEQLATLRANAQLGRKQYQKVLDVYGLTNATGTIARQLEFTAVDDMDVLLLGLTVWRNSGTITITAELEAIAYTAAGAEEVSKYLSDKTVSVSRLVSAGAENNANRTIYEPTNVIRLIKGITYRLTLTSNSATAVNRAYCYLVMTTTRRR
jgi:hypothetical protein